MQLQSTAFTDGGEIPDRYTHDGADVSPPLVWSGVPRRARSLALVVHDPDAPRGDWVHWVVVDLPPGLRELPEDVHDLPGGHLGLNDWKQASWRGPAPPRGRHRYVFKLFALDRELGLEHPTRHQLEAAMAGHVLAEATLIGTYHAAQPS